MIILIEARNNVSPYARNITDPAENPPNFFQPVLDVHVLPQVVGQTMNKMGFLPAGTF